MKKIAWITDSTCTLSEDLCRKHHIYKVPLLVILNGKTYRDGVEITNEEVFEQLKHVTASTSQPSIGDFVSLYEELKENYDLGVTYHISSKLSGTYSSSVQAGQMTRFDVIGVDSLAGVHPMSSILLETVQLYESGTALEDALDHMRQRTKGIEIYFTVGSLEQLHRSGRVKSSKALIGTLLNIKPIFHFEEGEVRAIDKARSQKRAIANILTRLQKDVAETGVSHVSIFHASTPDVVENLKEEVLKIIPSAEIDVNFVSPVVGVLTGDGTVGFTWIKNSRPL